MLNFLKLLPVHQKMVFLTCFPLYEKSVKNAFGGSISEIHIKTLQLIGQGLQRLFGGAGRPDNSMRFREFL